MGFCFQVVQRIGRRKRRTALAGPAHFFSVPLLATPAVPLGINDAGTATAAALVVFHIWVSIGDWLARLTARKYQPGMGAMAALTVQQF